MLTEPRKTGKIHVKRIVWFGLRPIFFFFFIIASSQI